jgi:hypothetical protein
MAWSKMGESLMKYEKRKLFLRGSFRRTGRKLFTYFIGFFHLFWFAPRYLSNYPRRLANFGPAYIILLGLWPIL